MHVAATRHAYPTALWMLILVLHIHAQPISITVQTPIDIVNYGSDGGSTYTSVSTTTDGTSTTTTTTGVDAATGQPVVSTVTTSSDPAFALGVGQQLRQNFEDPDSGLPVQLVATDPTAAVLERQAPQAARSGR